MRGLIAACKFILNDNKRIKGIKIAQRLNIIFPR
jgi:hypothetical protein